MIGEEGYRNGIFLKSNKFGHNGGVAPALLVSAYVKDRKIISGRTTCVAFVQFYYSVNRYKLLKNWLLRKPLQTVTNSYKQLQPSFSANRYKPLKTVTNRYKTFTPQTVMNRYKQLQTVTNHLLHKQLRTVTLPV